MTKVYRRKLRIECGLIVNRQGEPPAEPGQGLIVGNRWMSQINKALPRFTCAVIIKAALESVLKLQCGLRKWKYFTISYHEISKVRKHERCLWCVPQTTNNRKLLAGDRPNKNAVFMELEKTIIRINQRILVFPLYFAEPSPFVFSYFRYFVVPLSYPNPMMQSGCVSARNFRMIHK